MTQFRIMTASATARYCNTAYTRAEVCSTCLHGLHFFFIFMPWLKREKSLSVPPVAHRPCNGVGSAPAAMSGTPFRPQPSPRPCPAAVAGYPYPRATVPCRCRMWPRPGIIPIPAASPRWTGCWARAWCRGRPSSSAVSRASANPRFFYRWRGWSLPRGAGCFTPAAKNPCRRSRPGASGSACCTTICWLCPPPVWMRSSPLWSWPRPVCWWWTRCRP